MNMKYVVMCALNYPLTAPEPVGSEPIVVFDLDQCLYHSPKYLLDQDSSYRAVFQSCMPIDDELWRRHCSSYSTRLELFYGEIGMHPRDFEARCPMLDFASIVGPDPEVRLLLGRIKARRFCFTNTSRARAEARLKHLGLEDCFETIFCADYQGCDFIVKPKRAAYKFIEDYLGISGEKNITFFDDSQANLDGAAEAGWKETVLIKGDIKEHLRAYLKKYVEE